MPSSPRTFSKFHALAVCRLLAPQPLLPFRPTLPTSRFFSLDKPLTRPVLSHFPTTSPFISNLSNSALTFFKHQHIPLIPSLIFLVHLSDYSHTSTFSLLLFKHHPQVNFLKTFIISIPSLRSIYLTSSFSSSVLGDLSHPTHRQDIAPAIGHRQLSIP